jgi:hypothetical protein
MSARLLLPALFAAVVHAHGVRAEPRIEGRADAVRVEASDATVEEVLAALRAKFGLHYRTTPPLDRHVTGTYAGSLPQVVARLLDGYDYIVRTHAGAVDVIVVGVARRGAAPPPTGRRAD